MSNKYKDYNRYNKNDEREAAVEENRIDETAEAPIEAAVEEVKPEAEVEVKNEIKEEKAKARQYVHILAQTDSFIVVRTEQGANLTVFRERLPEGAEYVTGQFYEIEL